VPPAEDNGSREQARSSCGACCTCMPLRLGVFGWYLVSLVCGRACRHCCILRCCSRHQLHGCGHAIRRRLQCHCWRHAWCRCARQQPGAQQAWCTLGCRKTQSSGLRGDAPLEESGASALKALATPAACPAALSACPTCTLPRSACLSSRPVTASPRHALPLWPAPRMQCARGRTARPPPTSACPGELKPPVQQSL